MNFFFFANLMSTYLFYNMGEGVSWNRFCSFALFNSLGVTLFGIHDRINERKNLAASAEGAAAASAAALARPCNASMGALRLERGRVSSDSSSVEGAVLGTMPYDAYLCGWLSMRVKDVRNELNALKLLSKSDRRCESW